MREPYRPIDGPIEDRKRPLKDVDAVERAHTMIVVGRLAPPLLLLSFLVVVVSGSLLAGLAMGVGGALFFYLIVHKGADYVVPLGELSSLVIQSGFNPIDFKFVVLVFGIKIRFFVLMGIIKSNFYWGSQQYETSEFSLEIRIRSNNDSVEKKK